MTDGPHETSLESALGDWTGNTPGPTVETAAVPPAQPAQVPGVKTFRVRDPNSGQVSMMRVEGDDPVAALGALAGQQESVATPTPQAAAGGRGGNPPAGPRYPARRNLPPTGLHRRRNILLVSGGVAVVALGVLAILPKGSSNNANADIAAKAPPVPTIGAIGGGSASAKAEASPTVAASATASASASPSATPTGAAGPAFDIANCAANTPTVATINENGSFGITFPIVPGTFAPPSLTASGDLKGATSYSYVDGATGKIVTDPTAYPTTLRYMHGSVQGVVKVTYCRKAGTQPVTLNESNRPIIDMSDIVAIPIVDLAGVTDSVVYPHEEVTQITTGPFLMPKPDPNNPKATSYTLAQWNKFMATAKKDTMIADPDTSPVDQAMQYTELGIYNSQDTCRTGLEKAIQAAAVKEVADEVKAQGYDSIGPAIPQNGDQMEGVAAGFMTGRTANNNLDALNLQTRVDSSVLTKSMCADGVGAGA